MKKDVSLLVVLVLLVSVVPLQSFAANCQYSTTQSFLDYLDAKGVKYNWLGLTSADDEQVKISFSGENIESCVTNWFFLEDNVGVKVWNIITYSPQNYYYVLDAVNNLSYRYRYTNLIVDTSDNTVTAQFDMPLAGNKVGEVCYQVLRNLFTVVDDFVYPELQQYDIAS